jgi:hypothetical protein
VRKITFAVVTLVGVCGFGSSKMFGQDISSKAVAADVITSDTVMDQQFLLLRQDIRSIKKRVVAANLTLTENEAAKFWPLFEQYSADLAEVTDTRIALIEEYAEEYGTLTDEQADSLIRRWLDTDISAAQLRQKYVPILRKVLPAKKAATFFQLDGRISMMIDVELTSRLPLMQSQE